MARRITAWTAVFAVAAALSGCAALDSKAAGARTFTLWHYERPESAMGIAWTRAVELFKASHPKVTVHVEQKTFEQIRQNASIALNADDPPTILEHNKGNSTAGLLARQGLLADLTPEASARGWDRLLPDSLQTTARYDDKGIMGSGAWYGIPNYAEYVMVYYNKTMFAKYGLEVPQTFAAFESVMDTFTKAGVTPLSLGGAEYPAQQIFYELALSKANRAWVDAFQRYQGATSFDGPEFEFAAHTFAEWVSRGYVRKDAASVKAEEMNHAFIRGAFPMVVVGSWMYGDFDRGIKDFEWSTFRFPGNSLHPGSSGNMWVVPKKAKDKDLAYDFIDITMKPEIQNLLGNSGGVPVAGDPQAVTGEKNRHLIEDFRAIASTDGLAFYPDWPAPGFYDVLGVAIQDLINGTKTPAQVLDDVAKPYNEHRASLGG
jgi:raffinose/stachyose/melibiose transport system substrate-binding protein